MAKILGGLAVIVACRLGAAWPLMLLVGVVHATWLPDLPTIGYGTAVLIEALLSLIQLFIATGAAITKQLFEPDTPATTLPRRISSPTFTTSTTEWDKLFPGRTAPLRWHEPPL